MVIVLQRFVFDDWVPKKLEIELKVPENEINFEQWKSETNGEPAPGEEVMPEAASNQEEVEPELDQSLLNMVLQMGIPENPAKWSLYKTGNNNADMAVTWYFENMADESINQPLRIKKEGGSAASNGDNIPAESLSMMTSMGFAEKKCIKALKNCDMNVERATDWLFSHMDDPDSDVEADGDSVMSPVENYYECSKPGVYNLQSFITHLGASVHAGHYVCHIKRNGEWIYFNDAKVALSSPPIGKGYIYVFTKN